jgi:hypothetical protein
MIGVIPAVAFENVSLQPLQEGRRIRIRQIKWLIELNHIDLMGSLA